MNEGMLWLDLNPGLDLVKKVQRAIHYYQHKYGILPDLCLVHPSMLADVQPEQMPIAIRPYRFLAPGYLWIGLAEKS